jgi:hypothetical protein
MQTIADIHVQAAIAQKKQARTIATHKTAKPEIPTDWGCAGQCSQPPPSAPAGSHLQKRPIPEFFTDFPSDIHPTHATVILATAALIVGMAALVTATRSRRHRAW